MYVSRNIERIQVIGSQGIGGAEIWIEECLPIWTLVIWNFTYYRWLPEMAMHGSLELWRKWRFTYTNWRWCSDRWQKKEIQDPEGKGAYQRVCSLWDWRSPIWLISKVKSTGINVDKIYNRDWPLEAQRTGREGLFVEQGPERTVAWWLS